MTCIAFFKSRIFSLLEDLSLSRKSVQFFPDYDLGRLALSQQSCKQSRNLFSSRARAIRRRLISSSTARQQHSLIKMSLVLRKPLDSTNLE